MSGKGKKMSGTEQYFTVVLFNMLHKTFDPVNEIILVCTIILIRQHLNL